MKVKSPVPRHLTWAALLARWIEYAQASVALPGDAEGAAWKRSVAPVIDLQAVTFALADIDQLPESERALALDKSELIFQKARRTLERTWGPRPIPESLREIIKGARNALSIASRLATTPTDTSLIRRASEDGR